MQLLPRRVLLLLTSPHQVAPPKPTAAISSRSRPSQIRSPPPRHGRGLPSGPPHHGRGLPFAPLPCAITSTPPPYSNPCFSRHRGPAASTPLLGYGVGTGRPSVAASVATGSTAAAAPISELLRREGKQLKDDKELSCVGDIDVCCPIDLLADFGEHAAWDGSTGSN